MARKSLGYTHLIWICPNCNTRNKGPHKMCISCGSPQPKGLHFEQAGKDDLIRDEKEIAQAKAGADIHCPYCGARNPAGTKTCSQCLGDISEGVKRESGRVIGAYKKDEPLPIMCPACDSTNPADAAKCWQCGSPFRREAKKKPEATQNPTTDTGRVIIIALGILLVVSLAVFMSRGCSSSALTGSVSQVNWQRSIQVESYQMVVKSDWWDNLPDDADVNDCIERYRYSSDSPVEDAIEVCGTPYTVDQGSGYGEVVQDCRYDLYDYYCEYEEAQWVASPSLVLDGSGLNAIWPSAVETGNQRVGDRSEMYTIIFQTDEGIKRYSTSDYQLFQQAQIGTGWELTVDGFGNIQSISRE